MPRSDFSKRAQARAARETAARANKAPAFQPPGPPVPETPRPPAFGPPVPPGQQVPQCERTRLLHDDLAEVINAHAASPETVLMALELLRHQALEPRLRQMALA